MSDRTVIVSDLHLGRAHGAARSAQALRPLWQGAERFIVNGDAAEVHHPKHRAKAAAEILCMFDLCERDGVELTLLSGNHDPYITVLRHLHLAGGQVFITHGDVMHPAIAPWSPASARLRAAHEAAIAALAPEDRETLEARLAAAQHAGFAEWQNLEDLEREASHSSFLAMLLRPWALARVLAYWHQFPRLAADFVQRHAPEARFALLGHTHRAGLWRIGGRVIVNTGHFGLPGPALAVVLEGRSLSIRRVVKRGELYAFASHPRAMFELEEAAEGNAVRAA
jgi:predicted phosphodiesterase